MSNFPSLPPRGAAVLGTVDPLVGGIPGFSLIWFSLFKAMQTLFASGYTGTIATAKLTSGGTEGSIVFKNGVVMSQTAAT